MMRHRQRRGTEVFVYLRGIRVLCGDRIGYGTGEMGAGRVCRRFVRLRLLLTAVMRIIIVIIIVVMMMLRLLLSVHHHYGRSAAGLGWRTEKIRVDKSGLSCVFVIYFL
jgi:hypothetical protein